MFGKLFKRDPTSQFKRLIILPLSWNAERKALNNIPMGGTLRSLAPLGPASNHEPIARDHHRLEYGDIGVVVMSSHDRVDTFIFPMSLLGEVTSDPKFKATSVRIRPHGLTVSSTTSEADVQAAFGLPRERDADAELISLEYDVGGLIYEFDFTADGNLVTFTVLSD